MFIRILVFATIFKWEISLFANFKEFSRKYVRLNAMVRTRGPPTMLTLSNFTYSPLEMCIFYVNFIFAAKKILLATPFILFVDLVPIMWTVC